MIDEERGGAQGSVEDVVKGRGRWGGGELIAMENSRLRPRQDGVKIIVLCPVFLFAARREIFTTVFTS